VSANTLEGDVSIDSLARVRIVAASTALLNSFDGRTAHDGNISAAGVDDVGDVPNEDSVVGDFEDPLGRQGGSQGAVAYLPFEARGEAPDRGSMVQSRQQPIFDRRPHPVDLLLASLVVEFARF
jgi:hypothetical protein